MKENKTDIKSGKEILESFFESISKIDDIDNEIVSKIVELYKDRKLTWGKCY
jgi:hypothetical protein